MCVLRYTHMLKMISEVFTMVQFTVLPKYGYLYLCVPVFVCTCTYGYYRYRTCPAGTGALFIVFLRSWVKHDFSPPAILALTNHSTRKHVQHIDCKRDNKGCCRSSVQIWKLFYLFQLPLQPLQPLQPLPLL